MIKRTIAWALMVLMVLASVLVLASCETGQSGAGGTGQASQEESGSEESNEESDAESGQEEAVEEGGSYDSKEQVSEYLSIYKKLPKNYITKKEAKKLGWQGGSVEKYAPGKAIGGDRFGNYENKLPDKKSRRYYECDIDTLGKKSRGAKRIIYSDDGLIYYTGDHYKSFSKMPQSA